MGCTTRIPPLPGPGCPRCGQPVLPDLLLEPDPAGAVPAPGAAALVCPLCLPWRSELVRARSLTPYDGPAGALIRSLKYDGWALAGRFLGRRLAGLVRTDPVLSSVGVVTWIPSTPGRVRERGYNPAELLARATCHELGSGFRPAALLTRVREGPRQAGLPASERLGNVWGAFAPDPGAAALLPHPHVLLVDDVLTTGSTVAVAAGVLADAGAGAVSVVTVARALETPPDVRAGPVLT